MAGMMGRCRILGLEFGGSGFGVWGFRFGQQQAVTDAYQYLHSNEARIFSGEAY